MTPTAESQTDDSKVCLKEERIITQNDLNTISAKVQIDTLDLSQGTIVLGLKIRLSKFTYFWYLLY